MSDLTWLRSILISGCLGLTAILAGAFWSAAGQAAPASEHHADAVELMKRPDLRLQEQMGQISTAPDPSGQARQVVRAVAGAKKDGRVGKAALILPFDPLRPKSRIRVDAEFYIPKDALRNSIHLMDLECKHCGQSGNPGLRLYLRHGRIRIDRKKIQGGPAWVNDAAPEVPVGTWNRFLWDLQMGTDKDPGTSRVYLNGVLVLENSGRTLPDLPLENAFVDRLQIGLTANSNPQAATVYLGALTLTRMP